MFGLVRNSSDLPRGASAIGCTRWGVCKRPGAVETDSSLNHVL